MDQPLYDLETLRIASFRMDEWERKNFVGILPKTNSNCWGMLWALAGMNEEIEEFSESVDLVKVGIFSKEKALDAIADICLYAFNFIRKADMNLTEVLYFNIMPSAFERTALQLNEKIGAHSAIITIHVGLTRCTGKIGHHVIGLLTKTRTSEKHEQQIKYWLSHIWRLCYLAVTLIDDKVEFNKLIENTMIEIIKRDWKKFPDDANIKARSE